MNNKDTKEKCLQIICKNIAKIQKLIGMSDKEYAKILEIGVNSLKRIKKGEFPKSVTIITIIRIYEEFGIFPSQLSEEIPLIFLRKES